VFVCWACVGVKGTWGVRVQQKGKEQGGKQMLVLKGLTDHL